MTFVVIEDTGGEPEVVYGTFRTMAAAERWGTTWLGIHGADIPYIIVEVRKPRRY